MLAAFVLTLPWRTILSFAMDVMSYSMAWSSSADFTVLGSNYTFEDAAYPIAASFYVGLGF